MPAGRKEEKKSHVRNLITGSKASKRGLLCCGHGHCLVFQNLPDPKPWIDMDPTDFRNNITARLPCGFALVDRICMGRALRREMASKTDGRGH